MAFVTHMVGVEECQQPFFWGSIAWRLSLYYDPSNFTPFRRMNIFRHKFKMVIFSYLLWFTFKTYYCCTTHGFNCLCFFSVLYIIVTRSNLFKSSAWRLDKYYAGNQIFTVIGPKIPPIRTMVVMWLIKQKTCLGFNQELYCMTTTLQHTTRDETKCKLHKLHR